MNRIVLTSTDPSQHQNYVRWLRHLDPDTDILFLEPGMPIEDALAGADGLLLPGGGDPDPVLYGKPELRSLCKIDEARDTLEFAVIRTAVEMRLPILGICRGLQIMNVALGGTLIADLPTAGYDGHHYIDADRQHDVEIVPGSLLHSITGEGAGWVNSAHHQGVDLVAPRLAVSAHSHDGSAEALEWAQSAGKPFLLLLHWHPERLPEAHPLADSIGRAFLSSHI
ncbi:MAG: gamma-glutamyl-gamma-aminobutyrate hydrolase family protein [Bacteroidota bacterium]